jgi:hypothetical protein
MKTHLAAALLVLGTACSTPAQETVPDTTTATRNVATEFSASPSDSALPLFPEAAVMLFPVSSFAAQPPAAPTLADTSADAVPAPAPAPSPAPDPKFIYGGRDDFRWQLGVGADWIRFRSSIFNASAVGVNSSVTYFMNEWFGVEGAFSSGFAPEIFENEHVKVFNYGGGPKIAWRERQWEPWLHAIFGGAHEQPQTAGFSKNSYAIQVGGGADYRFNPRFSGRLEADWVRTGFFGEGQDNFLLTGGVVFHF